MIKAGFEKVTLATGCSCLCDSTSGAQGVHCDEDVNECDSSPCVNGICTNLEFNQNFVCQCDDNYISQIEDVNEAPFCDKFKDACKSAPCKNNALCSSENNIFHCDCSETCFTGNLCENVNSACESSPCKNSAMCVDDCGDFVCNCKQGWHGPVCSFDEDDCASKPCKNNGVCNDLGVSEFSCDCVDGYKGSLCEIEMNECISNPCQNGATCVDEVNQYRVVFLKCRFQANTFF